MSKKYFTCETPTMDGDQLTSCAGYTLNTDACAAGGTTVVAPEGGILDEDYTALIAKGRIEAGVEWDGLFSKMSAAQKLQWTENTDGEQAVWEYKKDKGGRRRRRRRRSSKKRGGRRSSIKRRKSRKSQRGGKRSSIKRRKSRKSKRGGKRSSIKRRKSRKSRRSRRRRR